MLVLHCQHQNYAEGEGDDLKLRLLKIFYHTPHVRIEYWHYALEFLDQVGCCLSKHTLHGRTSSDKVWETSIDVSVFRFSMFQPIWYYDPNLSFQQDTMSPGLSLCLAEKTGDGFTYVVLP